MNKFINLLLIVVGLVFVILQYVKWTLWALPSGWVFMIGIIMICAVTTILIMFHVMPDNIQKEMRQDLKKLMNKIHWAD